MGLAHRLFVTMGICLAATLGCAPPKVSLDHSPREYVPTDYSEVLDRWTRTEQLLLITELDDVLTATATYQSWDFRWAYVVRYSEDYRLTVDQRSALLEQSLAEVNDDHEFYVALEAKHPKWADLTLENSAWIVRLVDSRGNETAPSEIELVRKPGAIEKTYFPYTSPWRTVHHIKFPVRRKDGTLSIASDARWFGLRFTGAQGNSQLVWELARSR
jgi:hypothetical protein